MDLLTIIERFLARTDMPETKFGRIVVHDPRFVGDLRRGRDPRPATIAKVCAYIASRQSGRR